jgi:hypothetical protein
VAPDQIHVDSLLLADAAQVVNGKINMLGGGWNYIKRQGPDDPVVAMVLVGRIIVPWHESSRDLVLTIELESRDETVPADQLPPFRLLLKGTDAPKQPASVETATPFTVEFFGLAFPSPGEYAFVVRHGGAELARTRFQVNFES